MYFFSWIFFFSSSFPISLLSYYYAAKCDFYWLKIRACSIVILKQVIICPSVWPQVFDKSVSICVCVCSLSFFLQIFHFSLIWFIFQGKLQRLVVGRWLTLQFFLVKMYSLQWINTKLPWPTMSNGFQSDRVTG